MVSGTYTAGTAPSTVPSNPFGATPMIVIVWPFTLSGLPITAGSPPR
jgi:hypothetical protein